MAAAIQPIGDLYKSQLRAAAGELGVPAQIIAKAPSADLWPGQTDEGELGATYDDLDRILYAWLTGDGRWTDASAPGWIGRSWNGRRRGWPATSSSARSRRWPSSLRTPGSITCTRDVDQDHGGLERHARTVAGRRDAIGDLGDLSPRGAEELTRGRSGRRGGHRVAARLLRHLGVRRPTLSFTEHDAAERLQDLLARLGGGGDVGPDADAGMPAIFRSRCRAGRRGRDAAAPSRSCPGRRRAPLPWPLQGVSGSRSCRRASCPLDRVLVARPSQRLLRGRSGRWACRWCSPGPAPGPGALARAGSAQRLAARHPGRGGAGLTKDAARG